jgi:5-formyltetrahydrofolate cyclo-ligase
MDSFGSGEVLVIAVVALLAIDPKTAGAWWGRMRTLRRKWNEVRSDWEWEIRSAMDTKDEEPPESPQQRLRSWARRRVDDLGQTEFDQVPPQILDRMRAWEGYSEASDVAAFWPIRHEVPLRLLLEAVLADGKTLWLPRTLDEPGRMEMIQVRDLVRDLHPGKWGLQEPLGEPTGSVPAGAFILVPGEVFDLHGARIGKGGGFYDRWLASHPGLEVVGVCWDQQVHPGHLPQSETDHRMEHLLTPARFVHFALENRKKGIQEDSRATPEESNA